MKSRTFEVGKIVGQIQGALDNEIPRPMWGKLSQFAKDQNEQVIEELISCIELYVPEKSIKGTILMNLEGFLSQ